RGQLTEIPIAHGSDSHALLDARPGSAQMMRHDHERRSRVTSGQSGEAIMLSRDEIVCRPRVVIIGAGFGGLSAAKALAKTDFAVTLIDRHNYHLFQPLLYQVATAALSPADIASPIRGIVGNERNISVVLANVSGIDLDRREVIAEEHRV